jgi:hypothetical protein
MSAWAPVPLSTIPGLWVTLEHRLFDTGRADLTDQPRQRRDRRASTAPFSTLKYSQTLSIR